MDEPIIIDREASGAQMAPVIAATETLGELVAIGWELQAEEVDLDRVLHLVVTKAASLLRTDVSWLALYDPATDHVRVHESHGAREPDFDEMEVDFGQGVGGAVLAQKRALVITDYPSYEHDTTDFVRSVIAREGITSIMCAPMMRGPTIVGALYVANRSRTQFDAEHGSLLTTLATQASVAIENARLYRTLMSKTQLLEQTFEIHTRLGDAAVGDLGVEGVLRTLAALTDRVLQLEQEHVPPFRVCIGPDGSVLAADGEHGDVASMTPIIMHGRHTGRITVYGGEPLGQLEVNALDHGATVIALELLKHEAAHQAEWQLRGELLEELVGVEGPLPETVIVRANRAHIDLMRPHRVLAISTSPELLDSLLQSARRLSLPRGANLLATRINDRLILAVIGEPDQAHQIAVAFQKQAGDVGVTIGISQAGEDFSSTFKQAQACVGSASASGRGTQIVEYQSLGPLRFMLDVADHSHAQALVREQLAPLASYDDRRDASLLSTLRVFLESDGHHPTIAEQCHIHPSTVKYRLGRIEALLGVPLRDADTKFELSLALRLLDLFRARGVDLLAP